MRTFTVTFLIAYAIGSCAIMPPAVSARGGCSSCSGGGCSGGSCAGGQCAAPAYSVRDGGDGLEWRTYASNPRCIFLFRRGEMIGGWDKENHLYRDYAGGVWSEPITAPWEKKKTPACGCKDCQCAPCDCGTRKKPTAACDCNPCKCDPCECVEKKKKPLKPVSVEAEIEAVTDPQTAMDLPAEIRQWFRNPDGSCVQCSISMCGVDQNIPAAATLLFDSEYGPKEHGGGYPSRTAAYCKSRGISAYNVTGSNTFEWMKWAALTGRGAAIGCGSAHFQTLYGYDPVKKMWEVCNNNSPQKIDEYDDDHFRRLHLASGQWVVILNSPPRPERPEYRQWWAVNGVDGSDRHGYGQKIVKPQVERDEVIRRGDHVEVIDPNAIEDAEAVLFEQAVAPPADDSQKWFVYLVTTANCAPCTKLKADWASSADLQAFAKTGDPAGSWAHYTEYDAKDASQAFRFTGIQITAYPTVIVQPPRNGSYGDPKTVVFQRTGYGGDPHKLAMDISQAIKRYVATLPKQRIGQKPPWTPPPKPGPNPGPVAPQPLPNVVPNIPPDPPAPSPLTPGGSSNTLLYVVGALGIGAYLLSLQKKAA